MKQNTGFTLMEIILVIVILTIVTTIVIVSFAKLDSSQALDKSVSLVTSVLDEARSLTLSAKDDSEYGVYLDSAQVVLFKGAVYSPGASTNVLTTLDSRVGIRNVLLAGGGSNVIFKRLTGGTDEAGTLELFLKASTTMFRAINITSTGVVSVN